MTNIRSVRKAWGSVLRSPLRTILTLLGLGVGVAVLAAAFSVYFSFDRSFLNAVEGRGTRLWIQFSSPGRFGQEIRELEFNTGWLADLKRAARLEYASPFIPYRWQDISVGAHQWSVPGEVLGVYPDYGELCDLTFKAGSFFSDSEQADSAKVAVIAENMARAIWGSARSAVGKTFEAQNVSAPAAGKYTVVGVFSEPSEIAREFLGIPAICVPYRLPGIGPGSDAMMVAFLRVASRDGNAQRVKSSIISVLHILYVNSRMSFPSSYELPMWQGSRSDQYDSTNAALLRRMRMMSTFFAVIAACSLLVVAFGTLSLLTADTPARIRDTALRRAMGCTRRRAVMTIVSESAVLAFAAAVTGSALALVFIGPLLGALKPLLAGGGDASYVRLGWRPIILGLTVAFGSSMTAAVLASLYPAYAAAQVRPGEAISEG